MESEVAAERDLLVPLLLVVVLRRDVEQQKKAVDSPGEYGLALSSSLPARLEEEKPQP